MRLAVELKPTRIMLEKTGTPMAAAAQRDIAASCAALAAIAIYENSWQKNRH